LGWGRRLELGRSKKMSEAAALSKAPVSSRTSQGLRHEEKSKMAK
jgi:hypothetical protein